MPLVINDINDNANGDNFIVGSSTTVANNRHQSWYRYTPYIFDDNYKKHTAYIKGSNGNFRKVRSYIYIDIDIAIANIAIAGFSRSGMMKMEDRISIAGEAIAGISKASNV